jgi:proteasome lid subunit RPN8/RPN11
MNKPKHKPWLQVNSPALVFSPVAWLKLMFFLHAGETEVGGFGISAANDLLYVQDFVTVKQRTSYVTVTFADDAVADHFDACVDAGLPPARFARIWCHTHPGSSPKPSGTDEHTFERVFGSCDWSIMFIVSRTGETYARLAFNAGSGGEILLPVIVDWAAWPQVLQALPNADDLYRQWAGEFNENVQPIPDRAITLGGADGFDLLYLDDPAGPADLCDLDEVALKDWAEAAGLDHRDLNSLVHSAMRAEADGNFKEVLP